MQIMEMMNTVITVVTMVEITWRVMRHVQRFVQRRRDTGTGSADEGNPLDQYRGIFHAKQPLSLLSAVRI